MNITTEAKLFEKVYQPLVESLEKITDLRSRMESPRYLSGSRERQNY